jgi:hypothetical protein
VIDHRHVAKITTFKFFVMAMIEFGLLTVDSFA